MDLQSFLQSSQAPWLPYAALQRWGLYLAWGVVLGALTFQLAALRSFQLRGWLAIAVMAWSMWPGPWSPSYWLGLAFQSPSLISVVLCLLWTGSSLKIGPLQWCEAQPKVIPSAALASSAIILGWVLLGDMLALWPASIYAWGFSTAALALVCTMVFLLFLFGGARIETQVFTLALLLVLCLFVVTRLPTGNLWDALLDPWLWVALQVNGLRDLLRRRYSKQV